MKLTIDTDAKTISVDGESIPLYSKRGFELLTAQWLKVGWNEKYPYTFSWFGRPVIQLPEDMIRMQEVIYRVKPDVIVETGVAHGGSLIFYATLMAAMGRGHVIGVDIEIRPHNRAAIEAHELSKYITLLEGDSASPETVAQVRALIPAEAKVLVILDSDHSRAHVERELDAYHSLVTPGSYIVATDGAMKYLHDVPRGKPEWIDDNPTTAARAFAAAHREFALEQPPWPFNESKLDENVTYWPEAWLRRI
jgi:cephalosporin hydroxylase